MHVRMLVRIDAMLPIPQLMHLRMRVRIHRSPTGAPAHVYAHPRQGGDPPTRPPLWRNGFFAFLAQSALTSHLSGLGRRARL